MVSFVEAYEEARRENDLLEVIYSRVARACRGDKKAYIAVLELLMADLEKEIDLTQAELIA
jgi:hypothetical protein